MQKKIIIFLIILLIFSNCLNLSLYYKSKPEKMTKIDNIENAVRKLYMADVNSIRNLSKVANTLQTKGLNIPGNLTVEGTFNYLPRGTIVAFNGTTAPKGWALCNGQNGTPDLRGRFIYGYGARQGSSVGRTGGEESHKLIVNEMPSHNHSMNLSGKHQHNITTWNDDGNFRGGSNRPSFGGYDAPKQTIWAKTNNDGNHRHNINNTGGNRSHNNMPPYYVLSWIMKL